MQKAILDTAKESREFDMKKKAKQELNCEDTSSPPKYKSKPIQNAHKIIQCSDLVDVWHSERIEKKF